MLVAILRSIGTSSIPIILTVGIMSPPIVIRRRKYMDASAPHMKSDWQSY